MENILSIDIEEWFDAVSLSSYLKKGEKQKSLVVNQTLRVLNMLAEYNIKATFFILGYIAESFPDLVKEVLNHGHEVGIHGFYHRPVFGLSVEEAKDEIIKSKEALEKIVGSGNVVGYRAPSWSIKNDSRWIMKFLEDGGFLYDSSIFSHRLRFWAGSSRAVPHIPEGSNNLWEIPPSVITRFNIPFSGGFFLRFFPYQFIYSSVKKLNERKIPAVVYLHPWEMDCCHPRIVACFKDKFIHYHNIETTEKKLRLLLNDFKFTTVKDWLIGKRC